MIDFFKFLFSRRFVLHLIIAFTITGGGLYAVFQYLDTYTLHGQSITVPDFSGLKFNELDSFAESKQLRYEITDSIYDLSKPKGVVIAQHPQSEVQVKQNRKVYLTVNAILPPMVKIPNLADRSLRHAMAILESYNLKPGAPKYEPGPCTNCVLRIEVKDKEVSPGMLVKKNTEVVLVLGMGESGEKVPLPCLLSQTEEFALDYVKTRGINLGGKVYELCETAEDSAKARIYKQHPDCDTLSGINLGGTIDVFLTLDSAMWPSFVPDSMANQPSDNAPN